MRSRNFITTQIVHSMRYRRIDFMAQVMRVNKLLVFVIALFLAVSTYAQAKKPITKEGLVKPVRASGLFYYDVGDPKLSNAIVFIHGWTCNADFWKESLEAFPNYRVLALD